MKKFIASQLLSDTDWQKFITSNYDLLPEHSGSHDKSDVTSAAMLHDAIIEGMDKEKLRFPPSQTILTHPTLTTR